MSERHISMRYSASRTISIPMNFDSGEDTSSIKMHYAYIKLKNLADNISLDPNPRHPDLNSKPCRDMESTLLSDSPEKFTILNRGLVIVAESIEYKELNQEKTIDIDFGVDTEGNVIGGLVDGGHTYAVLKKHLNDSSLKELQIFITIIEGATSYITEIARARNTSVQVKEKSIANLNEEFSTLKHSLGEYSSKVIFFENEELVKSSATVPVEDLIALLTTMNRGLYDKNDNPIVAYSSKGACFKKWLNTQTRKEYERLYDIAPEIIELYDYLQIKFIDYVKEAGYTIPGKINGIEKIDKSKIKLKTNFTNQILDYKVAISFLYPVFASFRFLLVEDQLTHNWKLTKDRDAQSFMDKVAPELIKKLISAHSNDYNSNPNKTGKSAMLWDSLALTVRENLI